MTPLLNLVHTKVSGISYANDEVISIAFSNGHYFTVTPAPKYEAWTLTGDDLGFYVAMGI